MADLDTGPHSYIRIPPDGAGKRLFTELLIAVDYKNGTIDFALTDSVVGVTSGFVGIISGLRPGNTTASGTIYITPSIASTVQDVSVNEALNVDAVKKAEVNVSVPINAPGNIVRGANNPLYGQNVDREGAAYTRFLDGPQLLGAFGISKVESSEQMAAYSFQYSEDATEWSHATVGTGSDVLHLPNEASIALDVDIQNGDSVTSTTDRYHIYQPGFGQLVEMTVTCGDSGKTGVRRRWGYFDDNNGLFFEQDGTSLYVVERSSTSGSVVDTRIEQSNWNHDHVDGDSTESNTSGVALDVTNVNIYWIDLAWLGAGRARFGVYGGKGNRITVHDFHNANANDRPYMSTATLPVRVSIENTTGTVSPSRIKLTCAQVETEGSILPTFERRAVKWTVQGEGTTNAEAPLVSWRPTLTINGFRNSKSSVPESIRCYVSGQPCHLRLYSFAAFTGQTWNQIGSNVAGDISYDGNFLGGYLLHDWYLETGSHILDMPPIFNLRGIAARLNADDTQDVVVITGESLEPTAGDTTARFSFSGIDI